MLVLKFGGTSVATVERLRVISNLIQRNEGVVVVLSAMSGITNHLVELTEGKAATNKGLANSILNEIQERYTQTIGELCTGEAHTKATNAVANSMEVLSDFVNNGGNAKKVIAQGELVSTAIFSCFLESEGVENTLLYSPDFVHLNEFREPDEDALRSLITQYVDTSSNNVYIAQGFIANNHLGEIDNLNRGGSDYTASLIGAAIDASAVEIWTDIDGFHNNDPRFVENTSPIEYLSFDEAAELAYFGAKILHPTSVIPARRKSIPVWLKNTLRPTDVGTLISNNYIIPGIKAVAAKDNITTIRIISGRMLQAHGFLKRVFEVFDRFQTPIDVITTSEVAVSLTIDNTQFLHQIADELMSFGSIEVRKNCSIVSVVGHQITSTPRAVTKIYQSFENIPTHMISFGGSDNNITFVIDTEFKVMALENLNHSIFNTTQNV